jgi:hypothetical protein
VLTASWIRYAFDALPPGSSAVADWVGELRSRFPRMSSRSSPSISTAGPGDERVFVGRTGEPTHGDAILQAFTRARTKVDMNDFRFHDLTGCPCCGVPPAAGPCITTSAPST